MASVAFSHQLGWAVPRVCGLIPPKLLTMPEPHQGAGGKKMPLCMCVCARWGLLGGGFKAGAHRCHSPAGRGWRVWGVVCAWCSGPQQ